MAEWIRGTALGQIVQQHGEKVVGFVQQGIVYHQVWGVEAIRVHATAVSRPEVTQLSGALALAMTYGVPSPPAAVLVKAGLPSRVMALVLVAAFPAEFSDEAGFREWLPGVTRALEANTSFWPDPDTNAIWRDFALRWHNLVNASWVDTERLYRVTWDRMPPPPGTIVRLLVNKDTGEIDVCGADLTVFGRLLDRIVDDTNHGHLVARVHSEPNRISLHRFGPASAPRI